MKFKSKNNLYVCLKIHWIIAQVVCTTSDIGRGLLCNRNAVYTMQNVWHKNDGKFTERGLAVEMEQTWDKIA